MTSGNLSCEVDGIVIYKDIYENDACINKLLDDYCTPRGIDFNALMGSYRVKIIDNEKDETVFFGDNSGNMCYYYAHGNKSEFLLGVESKRIPDLESIAQFLVFGCVYSNKTIAKDIYRTNPNMFYISRSGHTIEKSKKLLGFEELEQKTLERILESYVKAASSKKKVAVITGGVDSRAVLALLLHMNADVELCITGSTEHIDVKIAKQISEIVGLPLHVFEELPLTADEDIISDSFIGSDGVFGVLGRYRLYNKSLMLKKMGFNVEFGGVAGELYKNSFINQDFPLYFGKPNLKKFLKYKIPSSSYPTGFFGEAMQKSIGNAERKVSEELLLPWLDSKKNKYQVYTDIGYSILQHRMVTVTNSSARFVLPLSPLMERSLVASIYNANPYTMECALFQRRQISTFYPIIKKIQTDRGLNCADDLASISSDIIRNYAFLTNVYINRALNRNTSKGRLGEAFLVGLYSNEFKKAMKTCKRIGIVQYNADEDRISPTLADRLMTVGMFFKDI